MASDVTTTTDLEALARDLVDAAWNDRDASQIRALFDSDVVVRDPSHPTDPAGPGAFIRLVAATLDAVPDLTMSVDDVRVADGGDNDWTVVARTVGRGTPEAAFPGIDPNRMDGETTFEGIDVFAVEDGLVVEWSGSLLETGTLAEYVEAFQGDVVRPGDPGYDEARAVWNPLVDRYPAVIAHCTGVADVIAATDFAVEHDLRLAVRGGGHNVAGTAVCDGGLVMDLSAMNGVHVDLDAQTARAEAGATWHELDRETQAFGLATPGGVVSTTGIAGLTLGGGLGWLRRRYGLTVDNLVSVDVVTADGRFLTANENQHPELFWGLRGGGGNFGVVTSFEYRLHPVGPEVAFAGPMYPLDRARDVLAQWREFMDVAPETVSSEAAFWTVPDLDDFPAAARREPVVALLAVHCGTVEAGRAALAPLREFDEPLVDLSGPMAYTEVQQLFDPFLPAGERCYYWKSLELDRFDEEVIDAVVGAAAERPSPETIIPVWHLGGAMREVGPTETAYGDREATYLLSLDSTWADPADTALNVEWTRQVWADMHRFSDGSLYLNFPGFAEEGEALVRSATGRENHERLVALKDKYDPDNRFRLNQNVIPSGGS
jgi:FAD/FMN-containing dehydrogenase